MARRFKRQNDLTHKLILLMVFFLLENHHPLMYLADQYTSRIPYLILILLKTTIRQLLLQLFGASNVTAVPMVALINIYRTILVDHFCTVDMDNRMKLLNNRCTILTNFFNRLTVYNKTCDPIDDRLPIIYCCFKCFTNPRTVNKRSLGSSSF